MRTTKPTNLTKPILITTSFLLFFLFLFLLRSSSLPTKPTLNCPTITNTNNPILPQLTCTKLPQPTAETLVHYVTSNITPQQTFKEIGVSLRVLNKKSPCNFLVFGLGHDSPMWAALNHGGRTVFLEEDKSWISQIQSKFQNLETYHVVYDTKVATASDLMDIGQRDDCKVVEDPRVSKCELSLKGNLPDEVYDVEWDLIMVDAPTGYHDEAPGRMKAIYTAGLMGRNRADGETDVFVHDVDRTVEDKFSKAFLCDGYMTEQEGRLRHFTIPSHRTRLGRSFCPL
ncbi:hypothetical protein QVD17_02448 [Tagetes erecta]|uniref:Polysaccharide biosynthesis domain-containing protein n=1 Tax=Tagetes erecta TaxID=13708 RepID=A0AAD8P954_TARER|nr:hypothetical protein QVD17_02448 [Tagetes erecta]